LVLPETIVLVSICFIDMIQTLIVVGAGKAVEANPVLASAMAYSPWAFVLLKTVSFAAPLTAVELLRPLSPNFVRRALRIGAVGYLLVYLLGSLHINNVLTLPF
jgi:hypothetical protein